MRMFLYMPEAKGGPTDPIDEQSKLSAEARDRDLADRTFGVVIFPGSEVVVNQIIGVSQAEIDKAKIGDKNSIMLGIIECIDYRFTFGPSNDHHQTISIFDLLKTEPNVRTAFEANRTVPIDKLGLGLSFRGANYAD